MSNEPRPLSSDQEFRRYRRTAIAEMADWHPEFDMTGVSVSDADRKAGSPKPGDKVARNPKNHDDRWLVAAAYFAENFEPADGPSAEFERGFRAGLRERGDR